MKKRTTALLMLLFALGASGAAADTLGEIAEAAKEPWRETVEAHGRQIVFDVTPQVPDAERIGVYHVTQEQVSDIAGEYPYSKSEYPEKRRGIAFRSKPDDVFTPDTFDPAYHAFGSPDSAQDVLSRAQEMIAPHAQEPGLGIAWETLTGSSPAYIYNKNTGEWGETAIEGAVGSYRIGFETTLYGVPLLGAGEGRSIGLFVRAAERYEMVQKYVPSWKTQYLSYTPAYHALNLTVPHVTQVLEEDAELASLNEVRAVLRGLAQEGLLRGIDTMRLGLMAFAYHDAQEESMVYDVQEGEVFLLKPVWVCQCEMVDSPDEEPSIFMEIEQMRYTVAIDARTGELIRASWVPRAEE